MRTMTAIERQRSREDAALTNELALLDHAKRQRQIQSFDRVNGPNAALDVLAKAFDAQRRLAKGRPGASEAVLAVTGRALEEIATERDLKRYVSLVDLMHKGRKLEAVLFHAGDRYRKLFLDALGPSRGVSGYGDFVQAGPASQRCHANDKRMTASEELKVATVAGFGVPRNDGRWTLDEKLMHLVIPAILDDNKNVTQGWIGRERTDYEGTLLPPAGATVLREVLHRLALHFRYRDR